MTRCSLSYLRFFIVAPSLRFNTMPPSVIPTRPVSIARPKPPDAGRVIRISGRFRAKQVTSSGDHARRLITSACDEGEGTGAVYWTLRATNALRQIGDIRVEGRSLHG